VEGIILSNGAFNPGMKPLITQSLLKQEWLKNWQVLEFLRIIAKDSKLTFRGRSSNALQKVTQGGNSLSTGARSQKFKLLQFIKCTSASLIRMRWKFHWLCSIYQRNAVLNPMTGWSMSAHCPHYGRPRTDVRNSAFGSEG
jgi:hypothetical protein